MTTMILIGVLVATVVTLGVEAISYKMEIAKIIANAKRDKEEDMIASRKYFAGYHAKMSTIKGLVIMNLVTIVGMVLLAQIIL